MTTLDRISRAVRELSPAEARVVLRVIRILRVRGSDDVMAPNVYNALEFEREMEVRQ